MRPHSIASPSSMRRVKKACVSSSAIPARWSTQPSRVTLMLKVRRPMAASLSLLPPPEDARLDPVDVSLVVRVPASQPLAFGSPSNPAFQQASFADTPLLLERTFETEPYRDVSFEGRDAYERHGSRSATRARPIRGTIPRLPRDRR